MRVLRRLSMNLPLYTTKADPPRPSTAYFGGPLQSRVLGQQVSALAGFVLNLWRNKAMLVIAFTALTFCLTSQESFASSKKSKKIYRQHKKLTIETYANPSVSAVFDRICQSKILFPKIVMQQVILETGWLKSRHLMSKNNLFGFRTSHYLHFKDWESSVDHYKLWQLRKLSPDDTDYYKVLDRIRYGAPGYITHLKKINWSQDCPGPSAWSIQLDFDENQDSNSRDALHHEAKQIDDHP
jgi:hypothetical protein